MSVHQDLAGLLRGRDFRRLFAVRLVGQAGDGMFQVGLATLFFFSPESQGTAGSIAVAFAVLLAPFTVVGPWAGVLLDRWRRRQVLVRVNLARVGVTLLIGVWVLLWGIGPVVYVLALANLSLNRFVLAALAASLPRVVPREQLLTANSVVPTFGAGAAALGGLVGLLLGLVMAAGPSKDAASLGAAAVFFACAAAVAARFGTDSLGPGELADADVVRERLARLGRGLVEGGRALGQIGTPAQGLAVMGVHRLFYGVTFVASILLSRNLLADPGDPDAGLAVFASVLAASAVGFGAAVLTTPVLARRTGSQVWVVLCLLLAGAAQLVLLTSVRLPVLLVCAALLGLAAQGAKIAVDTIVQRDTPDEFRGRAFALYDVVYNSAFIAAAAIAAVTLPDSGYSRPVFAVLALGYLTTAAVFGARGLRSPRPTSPAGA